MFGSKKSYINRKNLYIIFFGMPKYHRNFVQIELINNIYFSAGFASS